MAKMITTESYINDVQKVHKGRYDYSKTVYTKAVNSVIITCLTHGDFEQQAATHKNGSGCPKCRSEFISKISRHSKEQFISKAVSVHGKKYDYSKCVYTNNHTKVEVICPDHGSFWIAPNNHISQKQGCALCGYKSAAASNTKTTDTYIQQAAKVHDNKYSYANTVYTKDANYITVTCKIHGDFSIIANNHLYGQGCQACSKYGFDKTKPGILYYLKINNGEAYKIGITNRTVEARFSVTDLQKIEVVHYWKFDKAETALNIETQIKKACKDFVVTHQVLQSGNTEIYKIDILKELINVEELIKVAEQQT